MLSNTVNTASNTSLNHIKTIIFDIDGTLIYPNCPSYYASFGIFIHQYVQDTLGVTDLEFKILEAFYKTQNQHIEKVLLQKSVVKYIFEQLDIDSSKINWAMYDNSYDYLRQKSLTISAAKYFVPDQTVLELLDYLKSSGIKIIALSNAPEEASRETLSMCDIDPAKHFDLYCPWKKSFYAPPKIHFGSTIFSRLLIETNSIPQHSLSVGDSLYYDIHTAKSIGMATCHIANKKGYNESIANHVIEHVSELKDYF